MNEEKDSTRELDLLWLTSMCFTKSRPQWLGCMQSALISDKHPVKSEIIFLPMIDLSASNDSCIYSTMYFIAQQSQRYGFAPVLTFDQPLWWKATMIVANAPISCPTRNITLKLGGFHLLMSYVGCIGHLMDGSGLQEIFDVIYANNTVPHILSGKAISRAIRAHIILESALYYVFLEKAFKCDVSLNLLK